MKRTALTLILLFLASPCIYGTHDVRRWREVSPRKGNFTVWMPGTPRYKIKRDGKFTTHTFTVRTARARFQLTYHNNTPTLLSAEDVLDAFRSAIECLGQKSVVDEKITLAGHHGREWRLEGGGGKSLTILRVYVTEERVYWLLVEAPAASGEDLKDAEGFFSSFGLSGAVTTKESGMSVEPTGCCRLSK